MAKQAQDALSRYLGNRFPTANPVASTLTAPETGRDTGGAGAGLGGSYAPAASLPNSPAPAGSGTNTNKPTSSASSNPPLDWNAYLQNWGFPTDIVNELDRIFRTYNDPNQASAAALAYIRGTDWYSQTFPGINEGIKLGVINNEGDYRSYTNTVNDLYNRYYGRNVSGQEVAGLLGKGYSTSRVNGVLGGDAWAKVNGPDVQFLLGAEDENGQATPDQLQALGQQNSGIDSLVGAELQKRLDVAKQRLAVAFQGSLATPSLKLLNGGGLSAPSLAGGITPANVGP